MTIDGGPDDNYNYDDNRVKPIYLNIQIVEYISIRIFIPTILNTNIYSDIHSCQICWCKFFDTNIFAHLFVLKF